MNTDIYGNLMTAMLILLASGMVVPLFADRRKFAGWLNFVAVSVAGIILIGTSYQVIFREVPQGTTLINFGFFNIYFLMDSFSAFFVAIIAFMGIMSALYSIEYMEHYPDYGLRGYYFHFPVFLIGMVGLVTVDDLSIGFSISWQLMTIASYFLVKFEYRKKENVRGANKYLALMELAWLFILGAIFLVDGVAPGDPLHRIAEMVSKSGTGTIFAIYALILLGFGFKAGIFPLGQLWLPDAHSIAPSPISALLSGVMLKTGIYGLLRTFFWMVPYETGIKSFGTLWGTIIAAFGVATLFIGTVQSMKQSDAKRLLAYSSIGQIGYIVLAAGAALVMMNNDSSFINMLGLIAIVGALYHVLNHAIFKGLLFLTSGSILYATGTKDLNKLGGLLKIMPVSGVIAGIASLSISGMPPFSGFASKWTIISSSLLAGNDVLFLVVFGIIALFTSAITLSCYVKFFGMSFTASGTEWNGEKEVKEVPGLMLLPKLVLTGLCILQGLIPFFYFNMIIGIFQKSKESIMYHAFNTFDFSAYLSTSMMGVGLKGMNGAALTMAVPVVVLLIFAAAFIVARTLRNSGGSEERVQPTWLCGYQDLNNINRYRDSSMFTALKDLLWWTGGNPRK